MFLDIEECYLFKYRRCPGERCAANERTVAFSVRWRTKNSNKNGF
ncbi:hypothetical protein T4B_13112, partial [Trichinella pseudospiralis]